jgi:Zn-dependent protease with chaperone function
MAVEPIRARWFDGRSSQARPVLAALSPGAGGPLLTLREIGGAARQLTLQARDVEWPEAWSARNQPRAITVGLGDAGTLEVEAVEQWQSAFLSSGGKPPLAQRMGTRWRVFASVLVAAAIGLAAFYRWGTPWAAAQLTREIPLAWEASIADRALSDLDSAWLHPSRLPAERQARIRKRFDELTARIDPSLQRYRGYAPRWQLVFRDATPPNAFALPGGTIVLFDSLVAEADRNKLGDDAIAGVLAHEIGHVVHRHTTRLVVEQAVLNVGLGLAMGDVSAFVQLASSALTGLAYRRNHEAEADCFAVALAGATSLSTAPMADLLLRMEADYGSGATRSSTMASLLSSHPATHERALVLKQGGAAACSR